MIFDSCKRKIKHGKPFDSNLQNHIIQNKSNMIFVLMLNNIEEYLIAPCHAFVQFFQLQGYGQYKNTSKCCEWFNEIESSSKCIIVLYAIWWFINYYASRKENIIQYIW